MPHLRPVPLTKPRLLVALHLDGEAKVSQFDGSPLQLGCQQQVLGLQKEWGLERSENHSGALLLAGGASQHSTEEDLNVLPNCFVLLFVRVSLDL